MGERILRGLLTAGDVAHMFGRTTQTVMLWRRDYGMPYVRIRGDGRDSIRYDLGAVRKWARRNGKEIVDGSD